MNLPTIFNIAIGLIFIYLVLSLLASQIQEVIATLLEWRAEQLTRGIENLVLGDTDPDSEINNKNKKTYDLVDNLFRNPLIRNLNQTSQSWIATIPKKFISLLSKIPVIKAFIPQNKELNRNTINPAYLPAETFSSTILSVIDIPKAARVLTWLNAKRLIHYEIYNKIDNLLESVKTNKSESGKITQDQKSVIEPHYKELKKCLKSVLDDYKMERYGLSSTLIRLRTQIETFKRETEECFSTKESHQSQNNASVQTIKPIKTPIDKIIDFIFTPDKNDSDLVTRLRPSLTTILDLLIPPLDPGNKAIDFIFISEENNRKLDICLRPSLNEFIKLLQTSKTSKPNKDKTVNRFDEINNFIFQSSEKNSELKSDRKEISSRYLNYLISPYTSKEKKLNAYQIFKSNLKLEIATNLKNVIDLINPKNVIDLTNLKNVIDLTNLKNVIDLTNLKKLKDAINLINPENADDLINLKNTDDLINLKNADDLINLTNLKNAINLTNLENAGDLTNLKKAIDQTNLKNVIDLTHLKNAVDLHKSFIEVEEYFMPLAYQSFQTGLREADTNKSETEAKLKMAEIEVGIKKSEIEAKLNLKLEREAELCDSFTYAQGYFKNISDLLPESLRKSLYELAVRSRIKASDIDNQLDHFKQEIETWFDRSMDRASGVYKRNARGFAFLIGLVIAVSLNADTFYIVSRLSKDDALRNSIVSTSTQLVQNVQSSVNPSPTASPSTIAKSSLPINPSPTFSPSPTPKSASPAKPSPTSTLTLAPNTIERVKDNVDQSLSEITLPIGWNDNILDEQFQVPDPIKENETAEEKQNREKRNNERNRRKAQFFGHPIHPVLIMIMGWLITATAIMMGAPFWFDFLGLFINVRNTGSRPASKTDKN